MSYQLYNHRGYNIFLDKDESEMMLARTLLEYEPTKFQWLEKNLTPDDIFVDVGANKGDFTLFSANKCKSVYCIEPHPENIKWIKASLSKNAFTNIHLFNGCANNYDGEVFLHIGEKSGFHSMVRKFPKKITVNSFRLDSILPSGVPIVIKIDVEGAELLVLEGCQKILKNIRAFLIDVDSGDLDGVLKFLPDYKTIYSQNREVFLVN